jgi:hypothetical protein
MHTSLIKETCGNIEIWRGWRGFFEVNAKQRYSNFLKFWFGFSGTGVEIR